MELRTFGRTELQISPVGVGTWALGGGGWAGTWGEQSDDQSLAALGFARDAGINWIDTAPIYGLGHSEEVVGRSLQGLPDGDRPCVFTKCGFDWKDGETWLSRLTPERIGKEFEASARRLGIDAIDLYQIHWPDTISEDPVPIEESWTAMAELLDAGKVRAIGVSNFDVEQLEACERIRHVDSVQPPYSLIGRSAAVDVIPWARDHGTAVIAYSPMHSGLLTDRASMEWIASLAPEDWRLSAPEFQSPRAERNLKLRDRLVPIAERHSCSVSCVAVAWVVATPGITGAIVGGRSPGQVEGWSRAGEIELTTGDLAEIDSALVETGAGDGWTVYPTPG